jgi:hypothetical protein
MKEHRLVKDEQLATLGIYAFYGRPASIVPPRI